jgi:hypothetical protein
VCTHVESIGRRRFGGDSALLRIVVCNEMLLKVGMYFMCQVNSFKIQIGVPARPQRESNTRVTRLTTETLGGVRKLVPGTRYIPLPHLNNAISFFSLGGPLYLDFRKPFLVLSLHHPLPANASSSSQRYLATPLATRRTDKRSRRARPAVPCRHR